MVGTAVVQRATRADLQAVRETRLRALRDAPYAFACTFEDESAQTDEEWLSRLDGGAWFLASRADRHVGIVAGFAEGNEGSDRHLVAMWVEPVERGTGTAATLVENIVAWARDDGARTVSLWVADGNLRARRFYERVGFVPTGIRQPLPSDPATGEEQLVRAI